MLVVGMVMVVELVVVMVEVCDNGNVQCWWGCIGGRGGGGSSNQ